MLKSTSALPRILALTALVGGLAFTSPSFAAPADTTSTTSTTTTTVAKGKSSHMMHEDVETRIKTLHEKLMITSDQEDTFNAFAQVMRDNDANIKSIVEERRASGDTRTAVEDLESWQKITAAHADAASKLVDAFKPLYDALSDDQKKNADDVFGKFEGHRDDMKKSAAKTSK